MYTALLKILKDTFLWIILVLLLFTGGGLAYYKYSHRAAKSEVVAATATANSHETYASEYKEYVQKKEVRDEQVQAVLQANPVWASEPLPSDVTQLLRHSSGATEAVP